MWEFGVMRKSGWKFLEVPQLGVLEKTEAEGYDESDDWDSNRGALVVLFLPGPILSIIAGDFKVGEKAYNVEKHIYTSNSGQDYSEHGPTLQSVDALHVDEGNFQTNHTALCNTHETVDEERREHFGEFEPEQEPTDDDEDRSDEEGEGHGNLTDCSNNRPVRGDQLALVGGGVKSIIGVAL